MHQRKMIIISEFVDGSKRLQCSCGNQFLMDAELMSNAIFDNNGDIIGHCPACDHYQIPDCMSKLPRQQYGTIHITVYTISADRKQLTESTIIAGIGKFTDFTAWAAKMSGRLPDHLLLKEIRITQCTREEYDKLERQIVLRQLSDESERLANSPLLTMLAAMAKAIHEEKDDV